MNSSQTLNLIVKLAGFKLLVRANRFGCDSNFARETHDYVITVLDGFRAELAELIHLACEARRETDPDEQDDLIYHLLQRQNATERHWYDCQPLEVGGWNRSEPDGSFRNPVTGKAESAEIPRVIDIPRESLCGLPAILDDVEIECGIAFTYDMVIYKPRPRNPEATKTMPAFDPDAEIPW
ncbi:hypothetical protein C5748_09780 [Phyllobacterium phragmitis]|uniref:Uncharacterized protein n=1 Tax=Phyllobacterium phragmitis TaxID=2670329 RepID=A0A2S9IST5_9HYPH|nr:hypothetical protein [Phyllobacterium phragmitis]PRD43550.1 hypothetical protein C5748_09780 [Phyllobacterium phragmitis]